MKKILALCLVLLCPVGRLAAQHEQSGRFDVENFPKVSYIYHDYNPEKLKRSDFRNLKENDNICDFDFRIISKNYSSATRHTVILWEDMAVYGNRQYNFTKKVLSGFFDEADIPSGDKFDIAVFNRRKNAPSVLNDLTNGFTSDMEKIRRCISQYPVSKEHYRTFPYCSDMYSAVREALDLLKPYNGVKCVILFTAGRPMVNSGTDSEAQVLLLAQRLHIPVYIFQYYAPAGVAAESEGFAKGTYGKFAFYKDAETAKDTLIYLYPKMAKRYYGHTYQLTFNSKAKRGDDACDVTFKVDGREIREQFTPPEFSFKVWIKEHAVIFSVSLILLVVIVVLTVCLLVHKRKVRKSKAVDHLTDVQPVPMSTDTDTGTGTSTGTFKESFGEEIESPLGETLTITGENTKIIDNEVRGTSDLMHTKNLYPRLHCRTDNGRLVYNMQKPRITIGRADDNDLVLQNDSVSRHHAEIVFNGQYFEIIDNNSTNKVILNGILIERAALKNCDTIALGEVSIVFYL